MQDNPAHSSSFAATGPLALRRLVRQMLGEPDVLIACEREPYAHDFDPLGNIAVRRADDWLVAELEPLLCACSGTWIAHAGGSADRIVVDRADSLGVPPEEPQYRLRRLWPDGGATGRAFRQWASAPLEPPPDEAAIEVYRVVNERFAAAIDAETRTERPLVIVGGAELALLPAMVRSRHPDATLLHCWPALRNACGPTMAESPAGAAEAVVHGVLAADILAVETPIDARSFLAAVERHSSARIDTDAGTATVAGHTVHVVVPARHHWAERLVSEAARLRRGQRLTARR